VAHEEPAAETVPRPTMPPSGDPSTGLTSGEAAQRLRLDGPNALGGEGRRSRLKILAGQFASPLVLILVGASCLSFVVGDPVEAGIILAIVALSAALGFVQEARAEASVAALQARLTLRARVIRDGHEQEVPVHDVVRGDVVALAAGNIVPADGRLLAANHLYVDESSLTGESAAAIKSPRDGEPDPTRDADRDAFVFLGTSVVSGTGRAVITATGARTSYGVIAQRLAERAPQTDFQLGVRAFGLLVARVTLLLVVSVFAINVALQRPLFDSLLFAVALAVGLTPELLPAIVTLNLTRGARALAAHGVLVKRLPAIQNLGGVTVLCTDKTGTLTEGKLRLERSTGIDRDDATEAAAALALAYLNSHFQAGFANPLDTAILAQATAPADLASYRKLAELPYDFNRRLLSVVVQRADEPPLVVTKGAPESVVVRSTSVREDHTARPIDAAEHARLAALIDGASADGFRLVAVASRVLSHEELASLAAPGTAVGLAAADRLERDLVFEGVLLFSDPAKAGVAATIADLARQGVSLKVVTGDNELVARHTAGEVGLAVAGILTGDEMRTLTHPALVARVPGTTIFARVDPDQKLQVIRALRESGAVVGYLGDGINDAPALHVADVGISVDNATDVARSAADIILLEPSLAAIGQGVTEGRRTFANTLKYIRMGTSSNFGNMLSMAGASVFLPFLPMLPTQILLNNFLYDLAQISIPTDHVDESFLRKPQHWDVKLIRNFMIFIGPISSIFDFLTFYVLLRYFHAPEAEFHTGWFVESLATQTLVLFIIRTAGNPFKSRPSLPLAATTIAIVAIGVALPFTPLGALLGFVPLPGSYFAFLGVATAAYLAMVEWAKRVVMPRPAEKQV
jgi:Mg2+-importing ATPase